MKEKYAYSGKYYYDGKHYYDGIYLNNLLTYIFHVCVTNHFMIV